MAKRVQQAIPQITTSSYGLRRETLSPMETLAQSISTVAPTTTPVATVPLVFALAGNGTWFAYAIATVAVLLVATCIANLAKHSSSPGSLYNFAASTLPASFSTIAAWSLLFAYVATAASVIGGFYHYGNLLLRDATGHIASAALLAVLVTAIAVWIAWRDVKMSARLMLWIEGISVAFILVVIVLVLVRAGWHPDWGQLRLRGMTGSGLRLGLVLALFSFVGFESATSLGSEARDPLRSIPSAVIQSALLSGVLFTICAYAEVLGFHGVPENLGTNEAPMRVLARVAGIPALGLLIDLGALVSMFAGTLACITAAARVLLLMSHNGLAHRSLRSTHMRNETPGLAILITASAALLPVAILAFRGAGGLDVYGWMGSLATYGFLVTYGLVCLALPRYLRAHGAYFPGASVVAAVASIAMLLALVGSVYPVPEGPYKILPYIYLAYLSIGMFAFFIQSRNQRDLPVEK